MPLRLEIKRKLAARSERVKCVDFHPSEPWILAALYTGHIFLWNYQTQTLVKSIEVCDFPIRTAKLIPSKQWIICGSDDMIIRVYNYNTCERVAQFEAHSDYIRSLAVHPTLPLVLSTSDDMMIKLWDWDKGWENVQIFEGHTHYVMQVEFNPKDTNTFASASLDRTVKIWGLNSPTPHFTLEGHERGVNCLGYFRGGDKPYLVSGADDHLVKVWDYQTKKCVTTLEGHTNNVSAVCFHPSLPIILSGSEDMTVRIWHSITYRLENTLNYGMERVWSIAFLHGTNKVALGYDDGTVMIKLGQEEPVCSMEAGGKVVWAVNSEIMTARVKGLEDQQVGDGDKLPIVSKEMGSCEVYPQMLKHNSNGRLLAACGDGEYIVYTAIALKNQSYGPALEFVWSSLSAFFATRESPTKVKIYKNSKEHKTFRPVFAAEGIYGGTLLGVRSAESIDFHDWNDGRVIRRIDVCPRKVYWSETGDVVALCCDNSMFILRYNRDLVAKFLDQGLEIPEQGIEGAFECEQEVSEKVRTGCFVGDCFIYTNSANRLNYYVGGQTITLQHLGKTMYLLGYLPKEDRVYLMDKQNNIYSYSLLLNVLIYQTAIVRRDMVNAKRALEKIPKDQYNKIARFLESQELKELALEVTQDPEHKFELAMFCKKLDMAKQILVDSDSEHKWKQLGDLALSHNFDLRLAEECYLASKDYGSLLLIYSSLGDKKGMEMLAELSKKNGRNNVAFVCLFLLHRTQECAELLSATGRIPEAAFLTRTYLPSRVPEIMPLWKENVKRVSEAAAEALADPSAHPDKFPDFSLGVLAEKYWRAQKPSHEVPAHMYAEMRASFYRDIVLEVKSGELKVNNADLVEYKAGQQEMNHECEADEKNAAAPSMPLSNPSPLSTNATPASIAATVVINSSPKATSVPGVLAESPEHALIPAAPIPVASLVATPAATLVHAQVETPVVPNSSVGASVSVIASPKHENTLAVAAAVSPVAAVVSGPAIVAAAPVVAPATPVVAPATPVVAPATPVVAAATVPVAVSAAAATVPEEKKEDIKTLSDDLDVGFDMDGEVGAGSLTSMDDLNKKLAEVEDDDWGNI